MREIKFRAWDKKTKRMFIIFDSRVYGGVQMEVIKNGERDVKKNI